MKHVRNDSLLRFPFGSGLLLAGLLVVLLVPTPTLAATSWQRIASPNTTYSATGLLAVTAITAQDAWAVGYGTGADAQGNSTEITVTEHWNGHTWNIVPSPNDGDDCDLNAVAAVSSTDVWAVGFCDFPSGSQLLTEHWNGKTWSIIPTPLPPPNETYGLGSITAIASNDVWAVGGEGTTMDSVPLTMHWDGNAWSVVPTPIQFEENGSEPSEPYAHSGLLSVAAISSTNIWAVGAYNLSSSSLILHWDGTSWTVVPAAPGGAELASVSTDSAGDVWAVSDSTLLAEYWDGTSWQAAPSPTNTTQNHFNGVKVVSHNSVWAIAPRGVFHWNGTSWSNIAEVSQSDGAYLQAITSAGGFTGAVGYIGRSTQTTFIEGGPGA